MKGVRKMSAVGWVLAAAVLALSPARSARAENNPPTESYTEKIKRQLEAEDAKKGKGPANPGGQPDPYLQSVKSKLSPEPRPTESYIESVKRKNPEKFGVEGPSFTEKERGKLTPVEDGGAIAAVQEGRSELKFKRKGEIHSAFGFRYGASLARSISATADAQANDFDLIYGKNFSPDATLFYEYQLFHSEIYGSLGLLGNFGVAFFSGAGRFAIALASFAAESRTQFQFFAAPMVLGPSYRLNLTHYIVPFATVGPAFVPYFELRNDEKRGHRGFSTGLYASGGVMIPLDWISKTSSADLYYDHGVKRYSLTAEYSRLSTIAGDVTYNVSGLNIGLIFEY